MNTGLWQLPWRGRSVPHGTIDIIRGCNISCRACFNTLTASPKPIEDIRSELEFLMKLRRLSSVTILGGEATLHPRLYEIVKLVTDKGIRTELLTNGLDVDRSVCRELKNAGLDMVCFHIERGQRRSDLPAQHSSEDVKGLRREKAATASGEGLDVGLAMTLHPGEFSEVRDIVELVLSTPGINYLLVTLFRDNTGVKSLHGDLYHGFKGSGTPPPDATVQKGTSVIDQMRNVFGFEPFAYLGSNIDPDDPRWVSYLVGVVNYPDGSFHASHVPVSFLEKTYMAACRIRGKYPMYMEQNEKLFRKQLLLNGLLGGSRESNRELLRESRKPGTRLAAKRILFQNLAELSNDGRLIYCTDCPDAVLKNGSLVPVCISDLVT